MRCGSSELVCSGRIHLWFARTEWGWEIDHVKDVIRNGRPSSGTGFVGGLHIVEESVKVRKLTAFLPENKLWYPNIRCGEFLKLYSSFFPDWSGDVANRLVIRWQIPLRKKQETLPKGIHTKVLLTAVLASNANVLLLDEPTEGLDPQATEEILTIMAGIAAERSCTIVLATHRLDEVERICDRIAIIHEGKMRLSGILDDIKQNWKMIEVLDEIPVEEIRRWKEVFEVRKGRAGYTIVTHDEPETILSHLRQFSSTPLQMSDMNLREIYLTTTGYTGDSSNASA